jgi:hypothetical protein
MSMADNIKEGLKKRQEVFSGEQELRDLINSAASKSLKHFIQRLDAGEIPIDNISDFIRVIGAYKEINDIEGALDGKAGSAALPELNLRQERVINDTVDNGKVKSDEEGRLDITDMSTDDISDLIRKMDIAQNKANEEAY